MVPNDKKPSQSRAFYLIGGSLAALIIGFLISLTWGWILWNKPLWSGRVEAFAVHTLGDTWERQSRKLAGTHAVDCGRVRAHRSPDAATACALRAFHDSKPFRVRYDLRGIDSDVSAGLVYTPEGTMYGLVFDGDPEGQGGTSWSKQRTDKTPCPLPLHLYVNSNGRVNCFSKEVVPPHDIMSPNFESY